MTIGSLVLGGSLELLIDNRGKNPPFSPVGVPSVSGMSVRPGRLDLTEAKTVSIETWRQWMPTPTRPHDVVLTSEAPLGRVALIRTNEPLVMAQRVFCLRGRDGVLDSRFLYYAFRTEQVQADLASRATGSTVLGIRQPELRKVRIPAPPYPAQQAIAEVLGALDDKIAANDRVVVSCEELMVAIASDVDAFTEVGNLAVQSTAVLKPDDFDEPVSHFSLAAFDVGARPELVAATEIKSNKFVLTQPCVLFSKLNPRIPRIWNVDSLPTQMAVASTEFVVLVPSNIGASELWAAMTQPDASEAITQRVAGTSGSHQRIKPGELMALPVRDVRELNKVQAQSLATLGQICGERRSESTTLARTRDELLPLLMSGKVRVKDAEALAGEAV